MTRGRLPTRSISESLRLRYSIRLAIVPIFRPCVWPNSIRSGRRDRAVVLHALADHRRRREPRHRREVAAGLGVAGAHEHAAVLGLQREDMAWLHQVAGLGIAAHRRLDGARAVGCGDPGGHAFGGLDGDGECGAVARAVAARHGRQTEPLAALPRQRQADQAAAIARHEVDGLGADMVGGQDQVAFVLTLLVVDEDHHAAGRQFGD